MSSITIDPLLGRSLAGKYEIRELLGVGAMGKVYRAHHEGLDKTVAIKVLLRMPAAAEAQARRFKAEARAASRLEHGNSVQILDFGEEQDGLLYIVMEYLEGLDLQELIAIEGPLPTRRIAWIMSQVFSALATAHSRDVIHRDIKPGNIMLIDKMSEDGRIQDFVKVCDFGLAKILDPSANMTGGPLTAQGAVFGTPAYMSPEQARGHPLDPRADIYSCGVVMYKMITGHAPFKSESPTGVLLGHIHDEPPSLGSWGVSVDLRLAAIVDRAMKKDRDERYQTAKQARDALRTILHEEGLEAPSATGVGPIVPLPRPQSATPTEQVRLRRDQQSTQDELDQTQLDRPRATSALMTVYGDTLSPEQAALANSAAATLPEIPPANLSRQDSWSATSEAPASTAWWALIPGAIALIGAGALVVVLAVREPTPSATPPASKAPAAAAASPAVDAPAAAPEPASNPGAAAAPDPGEAPSGEAPPEAPEGEASSESPAGEAPPEAPAVEPSPTPAQPPKPRSTRRVTPARRSAAPKPSAAAAPAPKPAAAPATPAPSPPPPAPTPIPARAKPELGPRTPPGAPTMRLPADFRLAVTLADVAVDGAISRTRSKSALERHVDNAQDCLRPLVAAAGVQAAGVVKVSARIDGRGRLSGLEASGLTGAADCVRKAFGMARLPPPDTGSAGVRFALRYRTITP